MNKLRQNSKNIVRQLEAEEQLMKESVPEPVKVPAVEEVKSTVSESIKPVKPLVTDKKQDAKPLDDNKKSSKILGLFYLLVFLVLSVSFFSYFFTWENDQSYVSSNNGGWANLFKTYEELTEQGIDAAVDNQMGKIGALLSNMLIYNSFGISAFIIAFVFLIEGLRLTIKKSFVKPVRLYGYSLFLLFYFSLALGFFHSFLSDVPHWMEGKVGYWVNKILAMQIGTAGVSALLLFLGLAFLVVLYNIDFKLPESQKKLFSPDKEFEDLFKKPLVAPEQNISPANAPLGSLEIKQEQEEEKAVDVNKKFGVPNIPMDVEIPNASAAVINSPRSIDPNSTYTVELGETDPEFFTKLAPSEEIEPLETSINIIEAPFEEKPTPTELSVEPNDVIKRVEDSIPSPVVMPPRSSAQDLSSKISPSSALPTDSAISNMATTAVAASGLGSALKMEVEIAQPEQQAKPVSSIERSLDEKAQSLVSQFGSYDPKLDLSSYQYPPLDLLENYASNKIQVTQEELEENKNKIVETLNYYKIEIAKIKATIGPTVTLYEIIPAPGVRISKIKNLEDDIALSLAALGIRIIAPMPGRGTIGIEVPNLKPETVSMKSVLATEKFQNTHMDLPIALGKTISNEVYIADLAKMPHLLVAGATGQGKSVGINAILTSLLYKKHPAELKFVLVDPKKVELSLFKTVERHFLAKLPGDGDAIITDTTKVIHTLNSLCIEMDQRYDLLKDAGVRNLKEYNQKFTSRKLNPEKGHRYLPYIVLIVDEFADLIITAGKEVETPIARLAQLARAIGIHLVIATQRPSVNIITGTIKANFPARIAFRVQSKIDSRTILDAGGADQLIGRGDMLLSTGNDLIRIQCAFVDTPEVERVSEFIGEQRGYPSAFLLPEYVDEQGEGVDKDFDPNDRDSLFEDAARLVVMHQQGSTSLIQRKMKLGYNRAGRIMDQLEAAGIVGKFEGSKARDVLVPDDYALEQFLENLKGKS